MSFIFRLVSEYRNAYNDIPNFDKLPAIRWKIQNLEKLKNINPEKFEKEHQELKKILD